MNDPQRPLRQLFLKLSQGVDSVGSVFALLWLLLWSVAVLFFDGCAICLLAKNVSTLGYPSVMGEVITSEPAVSVRSDRWSVEFRYLVNGQEYTGDQRSFVNANFESRNGSAVLAERFALGTPVQVFYNPNDPADSALDHSLSGLPLLMMMFLLPFNAVMIGGWNWVRRRILRIHAVPVRREGSRWMVLTTNGQPLVVMLIIAGSTSLAATFVIVVSGWEESFFGVAAAWSVLMGLCTAAYWHTQSLVRKERPVLILDDRSALITWPASNEAPAFSLSREQLSAVELTEQPVDSEQLGVIPDFDVRLVFAGQNEESNHRTVLCTPNRVEAAALADWLSDWIAIKV